MNITQALAQLIDKHGNGFYATMGKVDKLPTETRKSLGFVVKMKAGDKRKAIEPHLGSDFIFLNKGQSYYICKKMPMTTIVLELIKRNPGKSPGMLKLPFAKPKLVEYLNILIKQNQVKILELNDKYEAKKIVAVDGAASELTPTLNSGIAADAFKASYNKLLAGRRYVVIGELRRALGWTKEEFDRELEKFRDAGKIQLMTGDASLMSEEDVRMGHRDENGFISLILTWRVEAIGNYTGVGMDGSLRPQCSIVK